MRKWWFLLVIVAVALTGCGEDGNGDGDGDSVDAGDYNAYWGVIEVLSGEGYVPELPDQNGYSVLALSLFLLAKELRRGYAIVRQSLSW